MCVVVMNRILILSASPNCYTGYARVGKYLFDGLLKKGYDVYYLGLQSIGEQENPRIIPVGNDYYGKDMLGLYLQEYNIDCIITICDIWLEGFSYLQEVILRNKVRWICHPTVNSEPLFNELTSQITGADVIVAPSMFSANILRNYGFKNVEYIPHGVNHDIFKPEREEKKEEYKRRIGYENKFVFLSVGMNRGMNKNWQYLFDAYRYFISRERPNCVLHCHTDPFDPLGVNLMEYIDKYNLRGKVTFTYGYSVNTGLNETKMANLYNTSDCHISASRGESFCLPALEAMACGIPGIYPMGSAFNELTRESAILVPLKNYEWNPMNTKNEIVDVKEMANAMATIYNDKEIRKKLSNGGIIKSKQYSWDKIIERWAEVVDRMLEPEEPSFARGVIGV